MMEIKRKCLFFLVLFFALFVLPQRAEAIVFDLVAPQNVVRGGTAVFTINIDTEGENVTATEIGMNYETQYLQFVSVAAGDAMTSIEKVDTAADRFLLKGTNTGGFTGSGVFATITFKVIATASGSTQLCGLWGPSGTPTPTEATPNPSVPTYPPGQGGPTPTTRVPTTLPKAGSFTQTSTAGIAGLSFILVAVFAYVISLVPEPKKIR